MKEESKIRAEKLLRRFKEGKTTIEEENLIRKWYSGFSQTDESSGFNQRRSDDLLNNIHAEIVNREKKSRVIRLYKYVAAASILLISLISTLFLVFQNSDDSKLLMSDSPSRLDHNKAIIELSDGRLVNIEDLVRLNLELPGVNIDEAKGLISFYTPNTIDDSLYYHIIHTPVGGEYSVVLPDGSKAKMNANSTIKFPNKFGSQREVEILGEVYFQIEKDKLKKFIVSSNHQILEVLGTNFNVKSYKEDNMTTTTLESGSLKVTDKESRSSIVLVPGQTAINGNQISLIIDGHKLQKESAWRAGEFYFDGENLEEVLSIVSRWYGINVVYQYKPSKDVQYGGVISRDKPLVTVLSLLADKENLKFEISGKEVIVKKENDEAY